VFDVLSESAREAIELSLYIDSISTTATRIIELFDVTDCIKMQTVENNEKADTNLTGKWEANDKELARKPKSKPKRKHAAKSKK